MSNGFIDLVQFSFDEFVERVNNGELEQIREEQVAAENSSEGVDKSAESGIIETDGLYRKTSNTGAFESLSEPMQQRHIKSILKDLGLNNVSIEYDIIRNEELMGKGLYGYTFPSGQKVQLYPDAFSSREHLVKTIGHERIHCEQIKLFGKAEDNEELRI